MSAAAESPRLLAVPNVSEGRDAARIGRLAHAFSAGATLLDTHSDPLHNRSVFTLAPSHHDLVPALTGGAGLAVAELDLREHLGLHPRIGALDVCPVVFLSSAARDDAMEQAMAVGRAIGELGVPVFLYGVLAGLPERRERAFFRRGGPEELARRMETGELVPDLGPRRPHPSAGATLVTARPPLAAFNIQLEQADLATARAIAAAIREAGGGLPGVRAIGLDLGEGRTQISTNVHDPTTVPLAVVAGRVSHLAEAHGAAVVAAEIVGLVPAAALEGFPADLPLPGFDAKRDLIEERLRLMEPEAPTG